jgi:hypothetical protein
MQCLTESQAVLNLGIICLFSLIHSLFSQWAVLYIQIFLTLHNALTFSLSHLCKCST